MLTFIVGKYASRTDMRLLASCAFLIMGATCFMRSNFFLQIDFLHIAGVQLFQGLGVALFFMPVTTILLSDLKPNEIASGGGLATFLRTLGASFSASLTTFLWDHRAIVHHAQLTEHITPYDTSPQAALQAVGVTGQASNGLLEQLINQQAYQISFNEVFHMLGWVFFGLIIVVWMARPPFNAKSGPAADH
jgi:DHA2 family multidrug resistance protein